MELERIMQVLCRRKKNNPLLVGEPPVFTTEAAEAFTTLGPLAGFTTEHPADQPRVTNIQKMADTVNGTIILPGEEWSINDHVGQRTESKGYVAAPAIIDGVPYCCDHPANIGGGVSQFGTTLFNAVFYSCLEDISHKPHSLYFTRYPMGLASALEKLSGSHSGLGDTSKVTAPMYIVRPLRADEHRKATSAGRMVG